MINIKEMINNTTQFLGTPAGITILILLAVVFVEFFIIWLLIWILKNNFRNATQPAGVQNVKWESGQNKKYNKANESKL